MNVCYLCGWHAPYEPALRDHLLTVHPGKENVPEKIDPPEEWNASDAIDWSLYRARLLSVKE